MSGRRACIQDYPGQNSKPAPALVLFSCSVVARASAMGAEKRSGGSCLPSSVHSASCRQPASDAGWAGGVACCARMLPSGGRAAWTAFGGRTWSRTIARGRTSIAASPEEAQRDGGARAQGRWACVCRMPDVGCRHWTQGAPTGVAKTSGAVPRVRVLTIPSGVGGVAGCPLTSSFHADIGGRARARSAESVVGTCRSI